MASDLDDILNDALNDFDFEDKTKAAIKPATTAGSSAPTEQAASSSASSTVPVPDVAMPSAPGSDATSDTNQWADEFFNKLNTDDPELSRMFAELKKAMETVPPGDSDPLAQPNSSIPLPEMPDVDFDSPEMRQKIEALKKMMEEVENGNDSEDVLDKILDAAGMSDMMHQLMSKDVLLDPFKDMDSHYAKWFDDNQQSTEASELQRYRQQHALVKKIIRTYESEGDGAADVVSGLVSEMQALGDPPQGMLQAMLPDMKWDSEGKPVMP